MVTIITSIRLIAVKSNQLTALTTWDSNSPIDHLGVFPGLMGFLEVHQEYTMKRENGLYSFPAPERETNHNGDSSGRIKKKHLF